MFRTLQEAILKVFTEYTAAGSKVVIAVAHQNVMKNRPERPEKCPNCSQYGSEVRVGEWRSLNDKII